MTPGKLVDGRWSPGGRCGLATNGYPPYPQHPVYSPSGHRVKLKMPSPVRACGIGPCSHANVPCGIGPCSHAPMSTHIQSHPPARRRALMASIARLPTRRGAPPIIDPSPRSETLAAFNRCFPGSPSLNDLVPPTSHPIGYKRIEESQLGVGAGGVPSAHQGHPMWVSSLSRVG